MRPSRPRRPAPRWVLSACVSMALLAAGCATAPPATPPAGAASVPAVPAAPSDAPPSGLPAGTPPSPPDPPPLPGATGSQDVRPPVVSPEAAAAYLAAIRAIPAFAAAGADDATALALGARRCGYVAATADGTGTTPLAVALGAFAVAEPGFTSEDMEAALGAALATLCPDLRTDPMPVEAAR